MTTEEGQVWSWGWGEDGRLGHGDSEDFSRPEPIKVLSPGVGVVALAAGGGHSLALTGTSD
jgi:E3 ubiquitin-protein ligase HERC2